MITSTRQAVSRDMPPDLEALTGWLQLHSASRDAVGVESQIVQREHFVAAAAEQVRS